MPKRDIVWTTKDRKRIPIPDMEDGHLLRAYRMICNQLVEYKSTMDFANSPLAPHGEIAAEDFEQYLDHEMIVGATARYWEPILKKEIDKRKLTPLPCKVFEPLPKFKQIAPGMFHKIEN